MRTSNWALNIALIAFSCFFATGQPVCRGEISGRAIAEMGLKVQWETNLGGAPLAQGEPSFVVWPHSSHRHEYVDVLLGNRLVERITADQIDREAVEKLVLAGKSTKEAKLGLEGAKRKAEKIVKTYAILGKKATVDVKSDALVYVITATKNGIVTALNGETGDVIWQTTLPRADLPVLGPGVSDEYVAVVNGNAYFVMDIESGNILKSHKLKHTPTGTPIPIQEHLLVPSVGGRLVSYDLKKSETIPAVMQAGSENRAGLAVSLDRAFLAWTSKHSMYLVKNERVPVIWSKVNGSEGADTLPVAVKGGFVFANNYGTVIRSTTTRVGTFVWRTDLSMQVAHSPLINSQNVFLLSEEGMLQSLDLSNGKPVWGVTPSNIDTLVGSGKDHVYAKDFAGSLIKIRSSDGKIDGRADILLPETLPNSIYDRFFFVTPTGQLSCVREMDADKPTFFAEIAQPLKVAPKPQEVPAQPSETKAPDEDDLFGNDVSGDADDMQ